MAFIKARAERARQRAGLLKKLDDVLAQLRPGDELLVGCSLNDRLPGAGWCTHRVTEITHRHNSAFRLFFRQPKVPVLMAVSLGGAGESHSSVDHYGTWEYRANETPRDLIFCAGTRDRFELSLAGTQLWRVHPPAAPETFPTAEACRKWMERNYTHNYLVRRRPEDGLVVLMR
ncbi:MAG: hypothetical protein K6E83_09775 [Clostridium sp.]|nr:hypothetical protein [Clostridium sp.]